MRGITEERLNAILQQPSTRRNDELRLFLLYLINNECTELNPWQPIETAPKDRSVNIYDKGYGQQKVQWNEFYKCFTDFHGHKYLNPTHWQELPEDP